jgi:hypothetical protein
MSNKKIELYNNIYDVNDSDEEIVNIDNVIELSELPQQPSDNKKYKFLNESVKRATSPDELMFRSDVSLGQLQHMKQMRDSKKEATYKIWDDLIEKGQKIDEDVIRMLQNYIIRECHSDNLENLERCRKYREILEQYWNKNPSLRERQQRIGGKRRRGKRVSIKRKTTKKKRRTNRATRRYKKHKR